MEKQIAQIEEYEIEDYKVPNHKIAFSEWNPDGKEVLVCIHSLITNSHDFDYLAKEMPKNFRVIAIDMPGRGDSDWFDDKNLYNYEVYIANFLALMKHLNIERFHFIGTSMGGITGMVLASKYPKMVESLILNDIGPMLPGKALAQIRKYVGINMPMPGLAAAKKMMKIIFRYFGIESEEHWDHMTKYNTKKGKLGLLHLNYDPKIAHTFVIDMDDPKDVLFWEIWDQIDCKTLLIHGEKSNILLQETVDKMNQKHNMDLYVVKAVGHAPALFNQKEIEYIKSWLLNTKQSS